MSKYLLWKRSIVPGPKVELFDKEASHHTLHLTETRGEGRGLVSERFDEARLVLLSEQTKDERFLTRLNYFMSTVHQDAWGGRYRKIVWCMLLLLTNQKIEIRYKHKRLGIFYKVVRYKTGTQINIPPKINETNHFLLIIKITTCTKTNSYHFSHYRAVLPDTRWAGMRSVRKSTTRILLVTNSTPPSVYTL